MRISYQFELSPTRPQLSFNIRDVDETGSLISNNGLDAPLQHVFRRVVKIDGRYYVFYRFFDNQLLEEFSVELPLDITPEDFFQTVFIVPVSSRPRAGGKYVIKEFVVYLKLATDYALEVLDWYRKNRTSSFPENSAAGDETVRINGHVMVLNSRKATVLVYHSERDYKRMTK